jgi:hypothetical protein
MTEARPAFYALGGGGWRDYVTLLHPPYTLWHLSYVAVGAAIAPRFDGRLLALTIAAFFLAMGVGAHALDEMKDRPLRTRIPSRVLGVLALASIAGAAAIGIVVAVDRDLWLLAFVGAGCFLVVSYNLELLGGAFHSALWFALGWGAFPLLTGYFASARTLRAEALFAAAFAALLSHAQRVLSIPVRDIRRRTASVRGEIRRTDGTTLAIDEETVKGAPEHALQILTLAVAALAVALVLARVT